MSVRATTTTLQIRLRNPDCFGAPNSELLRRVQVTPPCTRKARGADCHEPSFVVKHRRKAQGLLLPARTLARGWMHGSMHALMSKQQAIEPFHAHTRAHCLAGQKLSLFSQETAQTSQRRRLNLKFVCSSAARIRHQLVHRLVGSVVNKTRKRSCLPFFSARGGRKSASHSREALKQSPLRSTSRLTRLSSPRRKPTHTLRLESERASERAREKLVRELERRRTRAPALPRSHARR